MTEYVETVFTVIENIQKSSCQEGLADSHTPVSAPDAGSLKFIWGAVFIIVIINFAAFHSSLKGYFLADDFAHVDYLKQVFSGHADLLWKNFYSNWMQTLGTNFYRPFISIALATDYLLWGANPTGFHISNFIFQTLSSVFLFLTLNSMFPTMDRRAHKLTSFTAAALFSCHPLHPEVVSWIIARVDSVCTTFLFLSFWLYLLARQSQASSARWLNSLSLAAFVVSLMSKEMAVTLPPAIFLYELTNSAIVQSEKSLPFKTRCIRALKASSHHIAALVVYLIFRAYALGTVLGGYSGSVGYGLKQSLLRRWFQEGCLLRLLFPFNDEVTARRDPLRIIFYLTGAGALALFLARAIRDRKKSTLLPFGLSPFALFAMGWFLIALAPTVQVFDITSNLQGGRFVYLATAPVVLLISALIFGQADRQKEHGNLSLVPALSIFLAAVFILSYCTLAERNNRPWRIASRGVRNLRASLEKELGGKPPSAKIVLLNLPPHFKGAHMLYNSSMFAVSLKPPLSKEDLTGHLITFEPVTFGDSNSINRERFKSIIADKNLAGVFLWDNKLQALNAMPQWRSDRSDQPSQSIQAGSINSLTLEGSDTLHSPVLDAPSTDFDFVDLELKVVPTKVGQAVNKNAFLVFSWTGALHPIFTAEQNIAVPIHSFNQFHKYRFSVGERKDWISEGRITGLRIDCSEKPVHIEVKSARLVNAQDEIPRLSAAPQLSGYADGNGTIYTSGSLGPLTYDATKIEKARSLRYEISLPDSWFEHYSGTLRDTGPSQMIADSGKLEALRCANWTLDLQRLKKPGFYELRIIALDANEKPTGYVSNPINFQYDGRSLKSKKVQP